MDWEKTARLLAEAVCLIDEAIEGVAGARSRRGQSAAGDALTVVRSILDAVRHGELDAIRPEEVELELDRVRAVLRDIEPTSPEAA